MLVCEDRWCAALSKKARSSVRDQTERVKSLQIWFPARSHSELDQNPHSPFLVSNTTGSRPTSSPATAALVDVRLLAQNEHESFAPKMQSCAAVAQRLPPAPSPLIILGMYRYWIRIEEVGDAPSLCSVARSVGMLKLSDLA
jgi:hypothetical protein